MRHAIALCALLGLTACMSPLERCVAQANRSLWAAEEEVAELEASLARGHALETRETTIPFYTTCRDAGRGGLYPCFQNVTRTRTVRVAIDAEVVRARIRTLQGEIAALRPTAEAAATQCRATLAEAQ